jgi:hypothetical protein
LALYPLVVLFQRRLAPLVKTWPLLARAAVFPLILPVRRVMDPTEGAAGGFTVSGLNTCCDRSGLLL